MIIRNKSNNINKDKKKRINFLKIEIKKLIYKSIIQNLNVKPNLRSMAIKKSINFKKYSSISSQTNNLCLKSGRFKSVLRLTSIGRHETKKLGIKGLLQNIKIKAW